MCLAGAARWRRHGQLAAQARVEQLFDGRITQRHPLRDRRCELGEEVAGQPVIETPSDRDWAFAFEFVRDVSRRTQMTEVGLLPETLTCVHSVHTLDP